jgi:hypothetical protein
MLVQTTPKSKLPGPVKTLGGILRAKIKKIYLEAIFSKQKKIAFS